MSRDIRSFFAQKGGSTKTVQKSVEPPKRRAVALSSDEDEEVKGTPKEKEKVNKNKTKVAKKRRVIESDDDDDVDTKVKSPKKLKKPNLSKLTEEFGQKYKKLSAEEVKKQFDHVSKRVEKRKIPAKNLLTPSKAAIISLDDDDFNDSLVHLDEAKLISENAKINGEKKKTPSKSPSKITKESPTKKQKNTGTKIENKLETTKRHIENVVYNKEKKTNGMKVDLDDSIRIETKVVNNKLMDTSTPSKFQNKTKENRKTNKSLSDISFEDQLNNTKPNISAKNHDLNASVITDEDRHERKRMSAILYQKYKNRSSVINPGSKEIPKGKPNCLSGLTFIVTGVLESMERDEANQVIKDLGGKISTTVGKRLNYMVVGEEAGPKKIATAEELGVKMLSEDQLFDLIREKSGEKIESNKNETEKSQKKTPKDKKSKPKLNEMLDIKAEKLEYETALKTEKNLENKHVKSEKTKHKTPQKNDIKLKKEKSNETITKSPKNNNEIESIDTKTAPSVNNEMLPWVEKYKPTTIKQIIGQQGAASNCVKLQNWLSKWYINQNGKTKLPKPNPWAKNDDGSYYKAALLSGPPGVGKTTTVHLVCKELGFDVVEFNASDTRSKKLLKEEVSELLSNKSLYGYFNGQNDYVSKKHVLVMDEVDGMAGNEDRGGIAELISLIKESSVPVICMCNDRNHQKMRSLVNHCFDLRFNKPRIEQIRGPILSICFKEKLKLPAGKIEEIIAATNNDIRQTLNHLSLLAAGEDCKIEMNERDKIAEKDLKLGPWDVVRKVFTIEEQKNMTIHEKSDLFFNDYSLGPLFVQQNYLQVLPSGPRDKIPEKVALTADALSLGDLIDRRIRSNSAWTLLPLQAIFSSVMPGEYMSGHVTGQINFPGWLGKYSKTNKRKRLAQELHDHTRIKTSGSRLSVRQDYAPFLLDAIVRPLKENGSEGVDEALNVMKEYRLLREDIDSLIELTTWSGRKSSWDSVDGRVKAALTRAYNKEVPAYSYSAVAGIKKKKAEKLDDIDELDNDDGIVEDDEQIKNLSDDEEDEDNLENDVLIKAKKKTSSSKASTSSNKATKTETKKGSSKAKSKK